MSHDASVEVLMDHMNEVDKRRRLTVMHQKEVEALLAHATQEHKDAEKEVTNMKHLEEQLRRDLDTLAGEQKQVQLQLMMESNRVRQCDVEEPLLQAHTTEQLNKLEEERAEWEANQKQLEGLANAWHNDPCLVKMRQEIAEVTASIEKMKAGHESLEKEILALRLRTTEIEEARAAAALAAATSTTAAEAASGNAGGVFSGGDFITSAALALPADPSADDAQALLAAKESLAQEIDEGRQLEANHNRQIAAIQREVDDLSSRTQEMDAMLADLRGSAARLLANKEMLQQCLSSGQCRRCSSA